jgi:hypothetical protein
MIKKIAIITLSLFSIESCTAMQSTAAKTTGQLLTNLAKQAFSKSMTGLHWMIAGGPVITGLKGLKEILNEQKSIEADPFYKNADENITQFIKNCLKKTCTKETVAVKIDTNDNCNLSAISLPHYIIISQCAANEITDALKSNNQKILDQWDGTIQHEGCHIQKNDSYWKIVPLLTAPFITHKSVKIIRNALPIAKKTRSFLSQELLKIPTAIGKRIISDTGIATAHQYQEQRADNGISNDINSLNGAKEMLPRTKPIDSTMKLAFEKAQVNPHISKSIVNTFNFFSTHPATDVRIAKLNARITLLEQQSQNA